MALIERPKVNGWMGRREVTEIARLSTLLGMSDKSIDGLARQVTGRAMNWERMYLGNAYKMINALRATCRRAGVDYKAKESGL